MTLLFICSVVLATAIMGFFGLRQRTEAIADLETGKRPPRTIPGRWSNLLIALAVVYCCLLLAGLSYTGWFRIG